MSPATQTVQPGTTVLFRLAAWASASNEKGAITASVKTAKATPPVGKPTFTVGCGSATSCSISSLPTKQPGTAQVEAELTIPKEAAATDTVTVTFSLAASPQSSPGPTKSSTGGTKKATSPSSSSPAAPGTGGTTAGVGGTTYSAGTSLPIGDVPLVGAVPGAVPGVSTTIPAGSASSLFPQISPTTVPSPAPGTPPAAGRQRPVADSSTIPLALGSSEFGAQILGLIVLLLGVAIAVTRISLRKTRTGGKTGSGN